MSEMIGRVLGPYQVLGELGHGGMANVYRAVQPSIGREVAIKVLPSHFIQDRTFLERFNREVQVIARLKHPRILPVHDFGEQDGLPYIVMTLMEGGTLADHIQRAGKTMPIEQVAHIVSQIAEGLDFAHRKGVIHRDFKPSNVLMDEDDNPYLSDFGIAKVTEATAQLTGTGILGTPAYLAPEMTDQGGMSPLVDIYALGITLYQMVTGQLPYSADTPMGMLMANVSKPIPDARVLRPNLPDGVQRVIEKAMAKKPQDRYQSAGALAADLQAAISGTAVRDRASEREEPDYIPTMVLPQTPTPPPVPAVPVVGGFTQKLPAQSRPKTSAWVWIGAIAGVLGLMCCALVAVNLGLGIPALFAADTPAPNPTAIRKPTPTRTPVPPTLTEGSTALFDGFDSNVNGWEVGDKDTEWSTEASSITSGVYRIEVTAKKGFFAEAPPEYEHPQVVTDFGLSVDGRRFQSTGEAHYGLAFRVNSTGDQLYACYAFLITDQYQMYQLSLYNNGEWTDLISWTYSSAILKNDSNNLMVIGTGDLIGLYINYEQVNMINDDTLSSGSVGVATGVVNAGDEATFEFDNFQLTE